MKTCTKCQRELPLDRFSVGKHYRGGRRSWCKDCYKVYGHTRYVAMETDARERFSSRTKTWRNSNPIKHRLSMYKAKCKRVRMEYSIPDRLFEDLVTDNCYYCHAEPKPLNGIDRVDNSKGYLEDNVVSCCEMCNLAKRDCTRQQFESWAQRVAEVSRMVV